MDKLCEVYDWYMQVKDLKAMKSSKRARGKDIKIENTNITSKKKGYEYFNEILTLDVPKVKKEEPSKEKTRRDIFIIKKLTTFDVVSFFILSIFFVS